MAKLEFEIINKMEATYFKKETDSASESDQTLVDEEPDGWEPRRI